jgi:hypothetical protein
MKLNYIILHSQVIFDSPRLPCVSLYMVVSGAIAVRQSTPGGTGEDGKGGEYGEEAVSRLGGGSVLGELEMLPPAVEGSAEASMRDAHAPLKAVATEFSVVVKRQLVESGAN